MECSKRYFILVLLLVFASAYSGFSQDVSTSNQYNTLQVKYQSLTEKLNQLVIQSQQDWMEYQKELPILVSQAKALNLEVKNLLTQAEIVLKQAEYSVKESKALIADLTLVKEEVDQLLVSLELSASLMKSLEKQIQSAINRSNIGLIVAIASTIIAAGAIGYSTYNSIQLEKAHAE